MVSIAIQSISLLTGYVTYVSNLILAMVDDLAIVDDLAMVEVDTHVSWLGPMNAAARHCRPHGPTRRISKHRGLWAPVVFQVNRDVITVIDLLTAIDSECAAVTRNVCRH